VDYGWHTAVQARAVCTRCSPSWTRNPRVSRRYVGTDDDGKLRIVGVWESKEHADRFLAETLGPLLAKALGSEPVGRPEVIGIDVVHSYVREPVA
jgi:hypothetical protein